MSDEGFGPVERGRGRRGVPLASPPRPPAGGDPDDFGPVLRGRPQRGRAVTGLARVSLVTVGVAALVALLVGTGLLVFTSIRITRQDVAGLTPASGQMNVLVVGNDSREGLSEEELQALGTESVTGNRPDTIFLLSVSGGRAAMLAFPRDLYVTRCNGQQGRLNGAYADGGPNCMVQTVAQTSGIPITHYTEVNFLGFINIVEAVGGVDMHFDEPFADRAAGVDLPAGCQHLDGHEAIGYVRARSVDSDLGRIGRQQRFLGELAEQVLRPATLVNVPRLFATAGAVGDSLTTSHNLGTVDLLRLARAGRGFAGSGLATYTVPATSGSVGGASVLIPDEADSSALFAQFRDGSILEAASAEPGEDAGEAAGEDGQQPAPEQAPAPDAADAAAPPDDC